MEYIASPCDFQSFKSTPFEQLSTDHIDLLLKWFEEGLGSRRPELIGLVQSLVDELFGLPDSIRTDLLNALTWLYQENALGNREIRFGDLEANLDLLDSWDLEPALEILGYQIYDSSVKNLRRFLSHESSSVRTAARLAVQRIEMTRWFRRAS